MKVLFFTHINDLVGGANKSLLQLIIELKNEYGVECILVTSSNGELNDVCKKNGIENYSFKFCWWSYKKGIFTEKKVLELKNRYESMNKDSIIEITDFFKNKKIDLVHSNSSAIDIGGEVAKKLGIPHIWHIREFLQEDYGIEYYYDFGKACKKIQTLSSKIICISEAIKKKYEKKINEEKLVTIYNGIKKMKKRKMDFDKTKKLNILVTGLISEEKNQIQVIEAMKSLVNDKGYKDIYLEFAGTGEEKYVEYLKSYVEKYGLSRNISFLGYVNKIEDIIGRFNVGIMCSKCEAFGRVTVEYMLNELVVIASNTGANNELIDECGFIYDIDSTEDLINMIIKVYNSIDSMTDLKKKAFIRAENNFLSSINTNKIYELYNKIIRKSEEDTYFADISDIKQY